VAEIADLISEEVDDDVMDPDYTEKACNSSDSSDNDSDEDSGVVRGEVRVYMDPPVERGDADTDRDSGN
jgi:hypothetical protein